MKYTGQVKEASLLMITKSMRACLAEIKVILMETEGANMKVKINFEYILVVVEFTCNIQAIGHVLLVLRKEEDMYLEVICTEIIVQIMDSVIL